MKNLFKLLASGAAMVVGYKAGNWLWNEVLEDKARNLKNRFSKKNES